jgi:hypothetical protein
MIEKAFGLAAKKDAAKAFEVGYKVRPDIHVSEVRNFTFITEDASTNNTDPNASQHFHMV